MSLTDFEFQYVTGQARPGFPALHEDFAARSIASSNGVPCELDLRYGDGERRTFDFFPAQAARGTVVYFHPGYWQWRDKAAFRFIAPTFRAMGLNFAPVNYPLCPTVTLAELTEAVRTAIPVVSVHAQQAAGRPLPMIAAGHSAGGHLAAEMALTDWRARGRPANTVAGAIALSGLYDLVPLMHTTLNANLKLDAEAAVAASPLFRVEPGAPVVLFAVGADETPAMCAQSRRMHEAWLAAGNASILHVAPEADHFSLLNQLTSAESALYAQVKALVERALA